MTETRDVTAARLQQPVIRPSVTVFFTMVHTPWGVKRVGKAYGSRKAALEWVPFVRGAWRNCRVSVRQLTVRFDATGEIDERTKRRLDSEFNMDPPSAG